MGDKPLSASDQQFADQYAHLWEDAGEGDTSPRKPCFDIGAYYVPTEANDDIERGE